jgi:hypothetical protein
MNPIRREVLNGLFVLVISTLLSAAIAAFEIKFNLQVWLLIVIGVAVAVSAYVMFELTLRYMASTAESMRRREEEWLRRVGTPARLELNREGEPAGLLAIAEAVKTMSPGSDYTAMYWYGSEGGKESPLLKEANAIREKAFSAVLERLRSSTLREYKRIISFDSDVLANDHELKSGVLRVGEGPGTIDRKMGDHCRVMMETKGCSLYVAPAILRLIVVLYGVDKVSVTIETFDESKGGRRTAGILFLSDPPNGEIIEQFRQMERETERRMVAVHKIVFPEDTAATAETASR